MVVQLLDAEQTRQKRDYFYCCVLRHQRQPAFAASGVDSAP